MKKTLLSLAALTATTLASPVDFEQIPAAAQWYLHADVGAVRNSDVGNPIQALIEDQAGKQVRALARIFAFDPFEDLEALTLFGEGQNAVILVRGEFDRAHVVDVIGGADEHLTRDHNGVTVHSWNDEGKTQHAAFVKNDLLLISEQPKHLQHALDVLAGSEKSMGEAGLDGAPLMFGLANLSEMKIEEEEMQILNEAQSMIARMDQMGGEMVATVEFDTDDARIAKRMRRMIDGVLAMVESEIPDIDDYGIESEVTQGGNDKTDVIATVSMPTERMIDFLKYLATLKE